MMTIYSLLAIVSLLYFGKNPLQPQFTQKPDLVIEDVKYAVEDPTIINQSTIVVRFGKSPSFGEFTIKIGNVGTQAFKKPFYLSWTDDESEIRSGRYSHGRLVNQDGAMIPAGGSRVIHLRASLYNSRTVVKFFIQHDGNPHFGVSVPPTEELYADNNTFDLTIDAQ